MKSEYFMKAEDFIDNVTWIGKHIDSCKTHEQLNNMQTFCRMVVSKEWFPGVNQNSIDEATHHLTKLVQLQILKIETKI